MVRIFKLSRLASVLVLLLPLTTFADMKSQDYVVLKGTPEFQIFLNAATNSYMYANVDLQKRHLPLLYCQPPKKIISNAEYQNILEASMTVKGRDKPNLPVELILLFGLKDAFPCHK